MKLIKKFKSLFLINKTITSEQIISSLNKVDSTIDLAKGRYTDEYLGKLLSDFRENILLYINSHESDEFPEELRLLIFHIDKVNHKLYKYAGE